MTVNDPRGIKKGLKMLDCVEIVNYLGLSKIVSTVVLTGKSSK